REITEHAHHEGQLLHLDGIPDLHVVADVDAGRPYALQLPVDALRHDDAPGPTMAVGSSAVGSRLAGQPSRPRLTARPSTLAVCVGGRARNQADPTCCGKPAGREHYRAAPRVSSIFGCHRRVPRGATPLLAV